MSGPAQSLEVVVSGSVEPDPRRRRALLGVLAGLLVVVALAALLDLRSRQAEYAALTRCAGRGTAAVQDATARVSAMADYARPTLATVTGRTADGLYRLIATEARASAPGLERARAACAEVGVRRWHGALRAARSTETAYLAGILDRRAAIAKNGRAYFSTSPTPTADDARRGLAAARPPLS